MRTSKKLNYLNATKELIKEALREKGVEVSDADTFRSYANKVKSISTAEDLSVELAEQDAAITELEEIANSLPDAGAGGITPEGTMLIKQNGIYDVTDIAEVDVQVETPLAPTPDPPVFGIGNFKENGTYLASDYNIDGWSSLTIDVPSSGERDENETMYEMKREDYLRQQMGLIGYANIPTEEEYLQQQSIVNGLIEKITGVAF